MPEYRRSFVPGGTFFVTIVAYNRQPLFHSSANVDLMRSAIREVKAERPFDLMAAVVLPDHLHFLLALPSGDADFSSRIGRIKSRFTHLLKAANEHVALTPTSSSRRAKRESDVWQRRSWEHAIRDEADLTHHFDYIHYNPVKHGHVRCPHLWDHSSFSRRVKKGVYDREWCCSCGGAVAKVPYPESISATVGE